MKYPGVIGRPHATPMSNSPPGYPAPQSEQLPQTEPYREIGPMMATTFEKGVQQGRLQGLQHAARLVLEQQFGPLSAGAIQRLNAWPAERLEELLRSAVKASSLEALGLQDE